MYPVGVTCFRGLSDLLCEEMRALGYGDAQVLNAELVGLPLNTPSVDVSVDLAADLARSLRLARRVVRLLAFGPGQQLAPIIAQSVDLHFEEVMDGKQSFGVFCERLGDHAFTSEDAGRELGACVRNRFRALGKEAPAVDLRRPVTRILAGVHHDDFYLGVDLHGALDERLKRIFQHYAPLNPTIAAAMLRLSSFPTMQAVLDPMCGTGTVAIEAAHMSAAAGFTAKIVAGEKYQRPFEGMCQNLAGFGLADVVQTRRGDATNLDYIEAESMPLIVINPPYGIRIGKPGEIEALYAAFGGAAAGKGVREIVAITTRKRSWAEGLEAAGYEPTSAREVLYERLTVWMTKHTLRV